MNSKFVYAVIFVFFCILPLGYAIKCYRCDNEKSCRGAKTYECTQLYANETTRFLDSYYLNVNTNTISASFHCMKQDIAFPTSGAVKYKGCVYSNINSVGYAFKPLYQQPLTAVSAHQCMNRNGCNPAGRKSVSTTAIALPLVFVLIYKRFA